MQVDVFLSVSIIVEFITCKDIRYFGIGKINITISYVRKIKRGDTLRTGPIHFGAIRTTKVFYLIPLTVDRYCLGKCY